jgi:hypothetical protein
VLGHPVFARLALEGTRLYGHYFYDKVGTDLPLEGTLAAGAIDVVEGPAKSSSGHFVGTCDAKGSLHGTWTGSRSSGEFVLHPIPQSGTQRVGIKRLRVERAAKQVGPFGMKKCTYEQTTFELFGLSDPALERAATGQGVEARSEPILLPDEKAEAETCDTGLEVSVSREPGKVFRDFVTVSTSGYAMLDGAAHPANGMGFDVGTIDLRTGKRVRGSDVWAKDPSTRVAQFFVAKCLPKDAQSFGDEFWPSHFDREHFDLEPEGVHIFGFGYPHALGNLLGAGPRIPYDVLLHEGYLRADSPVRRAWEGLTPAAPGKAGVGKAGDGGPCE